MQVPEASGSMLRQYKSSVDNAKDPIVNSVSFPTPLTNTLSMELSEDCRTSMNRNHTLMTASTDLSEYSAGSSCPIDTSGYKDHTPEIRTPTGTT